MKLRHAILLSLTLAMPVLAQDKPARIIVPYPAGGNADNIARLFADGLSRKTGQPVIVENKPGAGAVIGAQAAATSPNDGSVLFVAPTGVFVVTPNLKKTPYDPHEDFIPVAKLTSWVPMMVARRDFPADTFSELIEEVRKNPGRYSFASAGPATMTHLMGELMNIKLGLETIHVPYKGSAGFVPDLMAGRIDFVYDSVVVPQVKAGQLKAMASMVNLRHPELPSIPTLKELGVDLETPNWYGLFVPKGTPRPMVEHLGHLSMEVMKEMDKDKLTRMSMIADFQGPAKFKKQIAEDDSLMRDVIRQAHITIE